MGYLSELKQYCSLEGKLDRNDVDACIDVAKFFDKLLTTYNKSAGEVFDDLQELLADNYHAKHNSFGDRISAYDLSMISRIRRQAQRKARVTGARSPYQGFRR